MGPLPYLALQLIQAEAIVRRLVRQFPLASYCPVHLSLPVTPVCPSCLTAICYCLGHLPPCGRVRVKQEHIAHI